MSLKTRLRIAIVALVTMVVIAMSALYLYDFTRMLFKNAGDRADLVAKEVSGALPGILNTGVAVRQLHPSTLQQWKTAWTSVIKDDDAVKAMLQRSLTGADLVVGIQVKDEQGRVLVESDPPQTNTARGEDFRAIQKGFWLANLWDLMRRREDYSATNKIGVGGQSVFQVTVVVQSVLLRHAVQPAFNSLALAFAGSLFIAVFLGSVIPNIVLDPLERVSRHIDMIRTGELLPATLRTQHESVEFAAVQSKLSQLGEQFQGAKRDALELRSNVEQLLQRLEEAVLLFDNSGRLVMAGEPAGRLLGKERYEIMGRKLEDVFPNSSALGIAIGKAVAQRQPVRDLAVTIPRDGLGNARLLVSVQVLERNPGQEQMGTLVTLRDVESRRQLERQLDVSSRLAAISRLTGGVAHEIKNPLNAMALHLEVLRNRLGGPDPEVDVIGREIKRLDNVVKTFLNFNKPIELQARPIDLSLVVEQTMALVSVDAKAKQIQLETNLEPKLWINGDEDLLKQAILNVVNNGMEAMQHGGMLAIRSSWDGNDCQVTITDAGPGIAPEIRDRIFHLYFTTKEQGTGIGLAMTFRVVQLHSGTIDFVSDQGKGTTFRLRFPGMLDYQGESASSATSSS